MCSRCSRRWESGRLAEDRPASRAALRSPSHIACAALSTRYPIRGPEPPACSSKRQATTNPTTRTEAVWAWAHDRSRSPACRRVWEHGPVKIMFASLGAYGHLYPMMPLALAGAAAGHETVIAAGPPFLGPFPPPTVPGHPPELELDWAIQEARRRHPDLHDQEFSMAMFADEPRRSSLR